MKKYMIIFSMIYIIFVPFEGMCKDNDNSVKILYKQMCQLLKENTDEIFLAEYGSDAFGYGIEILNKAPESIEAFHSIFVINNSAFKSYQYKIEEIFLSLNNKHYLHIDDPNFEEGEKLIYLILCFHGIGTKSMIEQKELKNKTYDVLKNMKENCKNKDYAALATAMLFLSRKVEDKLNNINYFIEKFPNHSAIPDVKLNKILNVYDFDKISSDIPKINECISETNKLLNEYGNINLPEGWNFSVECYDLLFYCNKFIGDNNNAKKYYELIEKEAPNYWLLEDLKEKIQ